MSEAVKKRIKYGLFGTSVIVLSLVAQTSAWLNNTIFETQTFTQITRDAFLEESSRQSIGNLVSEKVFESNPRLKAVLGDVLASSVANLLGTDLASTLVTRAAQEAQLLVTSPEKDPVVVDLTSIKSAITKVQETRNIPEEERQIQVEDIPDTVTLIDTTKIPNVHQASIFTLWMGPISALLALGLVAFWVVRGKKKNLAVRLQIVGLILAASGGIALLVGPLVEPPVVSLGKSASSQTLLRNIYEGFITPFERQATIILVSFLSLTIITRIVWEITSRYRVKLQLERVSSSRPKNKI